jgi:hypothetical protein
MAIKEKLIEKADRSFVDNWKEAHRWLSVQLALVFGIFVTYTTTNPEQVAELIEFFPQELRIPVGFLLTTVLPIYMRIKKQGSN